MREEQQLFYLGDRTKAVLFRLVVLSGLLKLSALLWKYCVAFILGDYRVGNPDEWKYLQRAVLNEFEAKIGVHWLYESVNWAVHSIIGDVGTTFVILCLINIGLSLALPFLFFPVLRSFAKTSEQYERSCLYYTAVVLFWPVAIWLSVSNLKDSLLAVFSCLFFSLIVQIDTSKGVHKNVPKLAGALLILYLIISTRAYLAAFLAFSTASYFLLSRGQRVQKIALMVLLAGGVYFSGAYDFAVGFLMDPEKNFLMSQEIAEQKNEDKMALGSVGFNINFAPVAIAGGMTRFLITPIPKLVTHNGLETLLIFQTAFCLFFLIPAFKGFLQIRLHHTRTLFYSQGFLVVLFYGIAESFAGPRQRFATLDILLIFFTVHYLSGLELKSAKAWAESKIGAALGLGLNFLSLIIAGRINS